ncbi:MAG TPA: glycosyltransferase family 9 protein [Iamia sp.]|nr:glycosyltransferase family 9 protein [Iamia sp.]
MIDHPPAGGHVAVVRLDGLGDVLMTGPTVRAVAAGADRVTFLCGPAGAEAAALLPGVDDVVVVDVPWVALAPPAYDAGAVASVLARVRGLALDGALVLTSHRQSPLPTALVLKQAGVPFVAATSADHPGALLDLRLRGTAGHEVVRGLALAAAAGYPAVDGDDLRVTVPPGPVPAGARGAVVVHPGATVPSRALPPAAGCDLVARLAAEGVPLVLTGSAAETAPLAEAAPGALDLGGRTDLATLARVLAAASVVVAGNTGPSHLAAAVGTPVVAVMAPVVPPGRWHPWTDALSVLGDLTIDCAGCRARTCPFAGQPCTAGVDGAALHRAVRRWRAACATVDPGARPAPLGAVP